MTGFSGRFADGRSADVRPVTVTFGPSGLIIDNTTAWTYGDLIVIEANRRHGPVRLAVKTDADARLTIESGQAAFLDKLKAVSPKLRRRHPMGAGLAISFATLALGAALFFAALVWMPPLAARLIPSQWEVTLGRRTVDSLAALMEHTGDKPVFCSGGTGQAALRTLTATLTGATGTSFSYQVRVLNSDVVNAFAASGGYIVVFRGLIDAAEDPDEVAAVLAHEIAHVEEHHVTEAMVRALGTQIVVDSLSGGGGDTVAGFGRSLLTTGYGRDAEREADARGLAILRRAGLHTGGMARFFRRLKAMHGDLPTTLTFLSNHPSTEERIRATQPNAETGRTTMTAADWTALKAICGT